MNITKLIFKGQNYCVKSVTIQYFINKIRDRIYIEVSDMEN